MRKFKKKSSGRSMLETLESRRLLAVISVLNNNDSGEGSLRDAIAVAQNGDTIDLSDRTGTITLASEIAITKELTITGPGAGLLAISGNNATRLFSVSDGANAAITDLSLTQGRANYGGAIHNTATLALARVALHGNVATDQGGAVYTTNATLSVADSTFDGNAVHGTDSANAGALYHNIGTLTITGSTFSNNAAIGGSGLYADAMGGAMMIWGASTVTIQNSTIVDNTAQGGDAIDIGGAQGGGLAIYLPGGSLSINNSTIANNRAIGSAGFLSYGGGVSFFAATNGWIANSIIAGNTADNTPDLQGEIASGGHNIVGIDSHGTFSSQTNGDLAGNHESPLNPMLGTLADNGGPTKTIALLEGSPAIDAGGMLIATSLDQRGYTRVGAPDIGAYEFGASAPVTNHTPAFTSTAPTGTHNAGTKLAYSITTSDADATDTRSITASKDMPSWLTLTDDGDGTATLSGTPTNANAGKVSFELFVFDGTTSTKQEVSFTVAAVNHGPTLAAKPAMQAFSFQPFKQTITATDADGDTLAFSVVSKPDWLSVTDHGDGTATLSGTPTAVDNGAHALTLKVSDGATDAADTYAIDVLTQRWTFDNGILGVYGSDEGDHIHVWTKGAQVRVIRNGVVKNFAAADVKGVEIYGFDGNDFISANTRTIPVYALGNAGSDRMFGGDEPDNFVGGGGKDVLDGGGGDDRLDGHNGNDVLLGGDGDDRLFGGEGNDVLIGGAGRDELHGGAGDDHLLARDRAADLLTGGDGDDKAEYDSLLDTLGDVLAAL